MSQTNSENFERFQKTATRQQFLAFSQTENVDPFSKDLCNALVGANIPFYKVNNPSFNDFLSKYCNRSVPVESTLRKNYFKVCYEEAKSDRDNAITEFENAVRHTQNLTRFGLTKTVIRDPIIDVRDTPEGSGEADGSGEVDGSGEEVATAIAMQKQVSPCSI
ncbi:hypothetical protein DdX_18032 [Ditylenchus destructor]|uniref:Uncharacterized protein n=1 Tax=Ditylenchus destructor TaxID=166010 RepID=A0AAD4QYI3_9BILA|nr:hypothetical protein DdX_18032 [Ditylenchus destructor]